MYAVAGIAVQVRQIDESALHERLQRPSLIADLGGDDRLHHRRQRGITGGDGLVVLVVGPLLLGGELLTGQEQCQDRVGLLQNLEAVDHQRVVVQQQRQLLAGSIVQVPHFAVQEVLVLRMHPEPFVVGDRHRAGRFLPAGHFGLGEIQGGGDFGITPGIQLGQGEHRLGCAAQVQPSHQIGVQVVVHHRGVLVGPGHRVNVEAALRPPEETHVGPQPCGLDQHRQGLGEQEIQIVGDVGVFAHGKGDVSVDVVLRRTSGEVGAGLGTVDGAPREQCAAL